jgi:hypothetical protein
LEAVRLVTLVDGVTLVKIHDGSVLRVADHTVHPCGGWAPADNILRSLVGDTSSVTAVAIVSNSAMGHYNTGSGLTVGQRVGVVNLGGPYALAASAMRAASPAGAAVAGPVARGLVGSVPLAEAPTAVVASALVTALANPDPATGAAVVTTSSDMLTLPGVYAAYRALHAAATSPGPVLLNLATLAADLDVHQANPLVAEAVNTVGRVMGWVAGAAAQRSGWTHVVALHSAPALSDGTVRQLLGAGTAVQAGVNAGWAGSGAPLGVSRVSPVPVDPLTDNLVRIGVWQLLTQPDV